jgi:hypothetical protein
MSYIIENISEKEVNTKFGPKKAYSINANGERYSYGFKKPTFVIGDEIDFQFTENTYGKNVDLTSVRLLNKGTGTPPPSTAVTGATAPSKPSYGAPKVFPIPALHGDRAIVRQNSITNAVKLITDSVHSTDEADWEQLADIAISIARKFEAYSCGDLDMEQAISMAEAKADE